MKVSGKNAIVFGAARGIGKACAGMLLQDGAKVCISDVLEQQGQETVKEFQEVFNENIIFVKCDVSKPSEVENVFAVAKEAFGSIQICVNSVGIMNEGNWQMLMDINFGGCVRITESAKKWMSHGESNEDGKLNVIHVCSSYGLSAHPEVPMYTASKHAMVGYVRSLAMDGELHGLEGFRINLICPYCVDTEILVKYKEAMEPAERQKWMAKVRANKDICMSPARVADAMLQLVENEAMNGQCMVVHPIRGIFVDEAVTNNFYGKITRENRAPSSSLLTNDNNVS